MLAAESEISPNMAYDELSKRVANIGLVFTAQNGLCIYATGNVWNQALYRMARRSVEFLTT